MKIYLTGSTGYVGSFLSEKIVEAGHELTCLVRKGSEHKLEHLKAKVQFSYGDATDPSTINLNGVDVVIHLIAILFENPSKGITYEKLNFESAKNMIDESKKQGVNRFLFMSAVGSPPGALSGYYSNKVKAENYLKESPLDWTIFKPSLIHGDSCSGKSMGWIRGFKWMFDLGKNLPLLGEKAEIWRPISREDISKAFIKAAEDSKYINKTLIGDELLNL